MDRRLLIAALACWPTGRLFAQDDASRPRHKISAATLHQSLAQRFPLRFGLGGLLEIEVTAPSLHMLPSRNKLGAGLQAQVSGARLQDVPPAEVDVAFALRYEAADRSVRAHQPEVLFLRGPGLPPEAVEALQAMVPVMAREALREVVLYRFTARDLAVADTMGFEPQVLTVQEDGLLVSFGPRSAR